VSSKRPPAAISFADKVVAIHRALADDKIPHAIGGALALAYYAEPRLTVDVDVNVFLHTDRWPKVRDTLAPLGVATETDERALARDGQVRLWWDRNPVDLFFSYDPLHDEMEKATRRVPFGDVRIPVLGPEHLTICKAIFDRPKDWLDIEAILIVTDPLDVESIETWIGRIAGPGDERLEKFKAALVKVGLAGERP
jgi:hypothetical protein